MTGSGRSPGAPGGKLVAVSDDLDAIEAYLTGPVTVDPEDDAITAADDSTVEWSVA
jgi:hypothetical protein